MGHLQFPLLTRRPVKAVCSILSQAWLSLATPYVLFGALRSCLVSA
jgi:hypothetical protein